MMSDSTSAIQILRTCCWAEPKTRPYLQNSDRRVV